MNHPTLIKNILSALNREVANDLNLVNEIGHPGENGRAREQIIRKYLRRIIPSDFGIDTGFVIDSKGAISKQIDIVIHWEGYYPIFDIGGVKYFIIESVAAVIENKASILSKDKLLSALENIKSVKSLDKTNNGINVIASYPSLPLKRECFKASVFGAILTENSLNLSTVVEEIRRYNSSCENRSQWLNMYADIRNFTICYLNSTSGQYSGDPFPASMLISAQKIDDFLAPLADLTVELINFLRVAFKIDFRPSAYFGSDQRSITQWKF